MVVKPWETDPKTYSSTKGKLDTGAASVPSQGNNTNECGFTTAPESHIAACTVNGVTEIKTKNPENGAVLYQIICDSGAHFGVGEDGSIEMYSVASPADDKNAGNFKGYCEGKYILKIGKEFHIEVGNKDKHENPLSIEVFGNVNIKATGGNLNLGGDNVSINAGDVCTINAGRTVQVNAGVGGMGGAVKAVTNLINGVDTGVAGGKVEINSGDFTVKSSARKNQVNVIYDEVSSERSLEMNDPRGTFGINSLGHMEVKVKGDYIEKIQGTRKTVISGGPPLGIPHPERSTDSVWQIDLGQTATAAYDLKVKGYKGNIEVKGVAGDFKLDVANDITLNSTVGGSLNLGKSSATLKATKNLVIRASSGVQVISSEGNYQQITEEGQKLQSKGDYSIKAATIHLN